MAIKLKKSTLEHIGLHNQVDNSTQYCVIWNGSSGRAKQLIEADPTAENLFVPYADKLYISVQTSNGLKWASLDMTSGGQELFAPIIAGDSWTIKVKLESNVYSDTDWFPLTSIAGKFDYVSDPSGYRVYADISVDGTGEYIFTVSDPGVGWIPSSVYFSSDLDIFQSVPLSLTSDSANKYANNVTELSSRDIIQPRREEFAINVNFTDPDGNTLYPSSWAIQLLNMENQVISQSTFTSSGGYTCTMVKTFDADPYSQPVAASCTCDGYYTGSCPLGPYGDNNEIWMFRSSPVARQVTVTGQFTWGGELVPGKFNELVVYIAPDSGEPYPGVESLARNGSFNFYTDTLDLAERIGWDSAILVEGYLQGVHHISVYIPFVEHAYMQDNGDHVIWSFGDIDLMEYVDVL